ncbi:MAG: CARDB domain-containing protein [Phycisphaeraceae bacterium]
MTTSSTHQRAGFEQLENRLLLSGDISPFFSFDAIPNGTLVQPGQAIDVPLVLQNEGTSRISGRYEVDFYAYTGSSFSIANAIYLGRDAVSGTLPPQTGAEVDFDIKVPTNVPAGTYRLAAVGDPDNRIAESNESNNTATTSTTVQVAQLDIDLTARPFAITSPTSVLAGTQVKKDVLVTVANTGTRGVDAKTKVKLEVYVVRNGDAPVLVNAKDVLIPGSKLKAGSSTTVKVQSILPGDLPEGTYELRAVIDADNQVAETDESNNTETAGPEVEVQPASVDLTVAVASNAKLPTSLVSGDGTKLRLPIEVTNNGNVPLDRGEVIDVTVSLERVSDGQTVLLDTFDDQSVSALKPGATKKLNLNVEIPPNGTLDGEYRLLVEVDTDDDVSESDETNNTALSSAASPIQIAPGFVDLQAQFGKIQLPSAVISGEAIKGTAQVLVANLGNVALPKGQQVDVELFVVPQVGSAISIGTATGQSVSSLKNGKPKAINVKGGLPAGLASETYDLRAVVTPVGALSEAGTANNTATQSDAVTAADPFVDFSVAVASNAKLPASLVSGDGTKLKLPIEVTNNGNTPLDKGQTIGVTVSLERVGDGQTVALGTFTNQNVSALKPGATKKLNLNGTIPPNGTLDGDYRILVEVDSADDVSESDETNNTALSSADSPIQIAPGFVDLQAQFGKINVDGRVVSGERIKGTVQVLVANLGNVPLPKGQQVNIQLFVDPSGGGDAILVGEATGQSVSSLKNGKPKAINVKVDQVNGLASGDYDLRAVVTPVGALSEAGTANNTVTLADAVTSQTLALDSIAGKRMIIKATSGDGFYFGRSGTGEIVYDSDSDQYGRVGIGSSTGGATGTYDYTKTSDTTATANFTDTSVGVGWTTSLVFRDFNTIDYEFSNGIGGWQKGTLTIIDPGDAVLPDSLRGIEAQLTAIRGTDPFASRGQARVAFSPTSDTYQITDIGSGIVSSTGSYRYYPNGSNVAYLELTDSSFGDAVLFLYYDGSTITHYTIASLNPFFPEGQQYGRAEQL